jgi:hypothetical protein
MDLDHIHQLIPNAKPLELREHLDLAKEKKVVGEKREDEGKKMKCFRCQESGHHHKDCGNMPICYKCKEEGHMAVECFEYHAKAGELKMFNFAIPE